MKALEDCFYVVLVDVISERFVLGSCSFCRCGFWGRTLEDGLFQTQPLSRRLLPLSPSTRANFFRQIERAARKRKADKEEM